jgi:glycerophosphoryl diester phosphodiesterase
MKTAFYLIAFAASITASCSLPKKATMLQATTNFDFEGHRGARGLMPENTIPAMKTAIDLGVTTVEMDVVISKDGKVVVSHDPFFHENITTTPEGKHLSKKQAEELLLFQMPYEEIRKYDVGLKPHPGFPQQQKIKAFKPLLTELIDSVEQYSKSKGGDIRYNIEIKSRESTDGVRHPDPKNFSELLIAVLREKNILNRTIIQSFDVRPLQYIRKTYPSIALSYLVENTSASLQEQLDKLGFIPNVYSPMYPSVTKEMIDQSHQKGMKVVPWTVNTVKEMNSLVAMGVDGIISDYPNYFSQLQVSK